ncbi:unnamed protein product [Chrysodeixis includens]|uniref:Phosphatidylinositol-glycan biosynthesis class X protein n=1 Tax=Chrysodeixis includens TaxID=689277 RepID=A0A9P0BPS3_CHRIL|nr:unnamed protein product [Chrysodeixis includens]
MLGCRQNMRVLISCIVFLSSVHYLSAFSCEFNVRLKQTLKNEGFHRNLTYGIILNGEDDQCWLFKDCILGLEQVLPRGVFANPDELSALRRINKINAVPKQQVNVELPAEQSPPTVTYVIEKIQNCKVYMWLPVHARYHAALYGGGMTRNKINPPKLYLRCPDQRLEMCNRSAKPVNFLCNGSSKEKCSWKEIPYSVMSESIVWKIPVGNLDHYTKISVGTALVIAIGSLYLIKAIHEHKLITSFNPFNNPLS